jgi:hypothetical protein
VAGDMLLVFYSLTKRNIMNSVNEIPSQYINAPIGELLQKYQTPVAKMFVEKVLNKISPPEFDAVRKWARFPDSEIKEFSNERELDYQPNKSYLELVLSSMTAAVLLNHEFQKRYPTHKVGYNEKCTPFDTTCNPTRHWLTVDEQDGKEFDEAHDGAPITLS